METQEQLKAKWLNQNTLEGKEAFKVVNDLAKELSNILNKPVLSGQVKKMVNLKTGEEKYYY